MKEQAMIDRLMALGFNAGAAKFLAAEIAAGRKKLTKVEFSALDFNYIERINKEHGDEA